MNDLARLQQNLRGVRNRIADACIRVRRDPGSVTLVAVTKAIPVELIPRLAEFGVTDIGENRPVEGLARVGALSGFRRHMIGQVQTNKVGKTLRWADAIHSVDRPSLVRALSEHSRKVPIFVQVNVSGESSKGGYDPGDVERAVADARRGLDVIGLMTMAPEGVDGRPLFRKLKDMAAQVGLGNLSMGMTQDFEIAVEEGATHVRVGTAIFDGVLI